MRSKLVSGAAVALLLTACAGDTPAPGTGGRPFRLLIHCGLSFPLEHEEQLWLPVDPRFRRTHNPPEDFGGDENYDEGTIRRVDEDTLIYTSSAGVEVEYAPTNKRPGGCE